MLPNVQFFAGFTSSSVFRYSATFIVRLKNFPTTPGLHGMSSSRSWSLQDCGCGRAMSFGGLFQRNQARKMLQITPSCTMTAGPIQADFLHEMRQFDSLCKLHVLWSAAKIPTSVAL